MSRSQRLNDLMQVLRRHRGAVSGKVLADETNVSLRTIRRDIATLQEMGANIDGGAGVGYVLRPGFLLPPISLTEDEIQALVVGALWVSHQTDPALALAAKNALAKIGAVIPADMKILMDDDLFYVGDRLASTNIDLGMVRRAIQEQHKLHIIYADSAGKTQERDIWPLILGFVDSKWSIAAWCELQACYRSFQIEHIREANCLEASYPHNRRQLAKEWRNSFCSKNATMLQDK